MDRKNPETWNFIVGLIGIPIALTAIYAGVAVPMHYPPFSVDASQLSLPAGYLGIWHGRISTSDLDWTDFGPEVQLTITLHSGGVNQDVGSIQVSAPGLNLSGGNPTCVAGLYWQSGNGPVTLSFDENNSTDVCQIVSSLASATISLVNAGELNYTIDFEGITDSTSLYR